jgi:hypothetical protein
MANSGKFGIKKLAISSGTLGVFDIINDSQIRVIVENAGASNLVAVYGRIQGQNNYQLINTVTGSNSKLIDVALFDFLDLEVITYDSLSIYIDIAGSGFGNSGAGGTPSQLAANVTVTNFPTIQQVTGGLTDTQLRAAPVPVTAFSGALTQGVPYDSITATYNTTQDIYVYKLGATTQFTITLTYTDSSKAILTSVGRL